MSTPVRTRIAPSPTGDPHVGTAYAALFNRAFAHGRGGQFILRIEDTDRTRSTPESEAAILDALRWLGLTWDEGPDCGGPHGPYRQSERLGIYAEQVARLLEQGNAYRCFCTKERLDEVRKASTGGGGYDRHCRGLEPAEAAARATAGESHVIRMRIPLDGECVFHDVLRGEIRKDWASIDDQVILKSDGFPTYHLANVVDDHLMGITHVLRGEEWINSVPKHVQLYRDLGWEPPVFAHLPLLRNNDANKTKLSKRKNPTSIAYYRRAGYLPQAVVNYLGLMGWTPPDGEEKFDPAHVAATFEIEAVSLGGPVFDTDKLRWLNGRYLREDLTPATLVETVRDWGFAPERLERIAALVQPRLEVLGDWGAMTAPFFADRVEVDAGALEVKGRSPEETADLLQIVIWRLEELRPFSAETIQTLFGELAGAMELKLRDFNLPIYAALSGRRVWTPLFDSMEILGSDMVRTRLRHAIDVLGGISGKRLKKLEKEYQARFTAGRTGERG